MLVIPPRLSGLLNFPTADDEQSVQADDPKGLKGLQLRSVNPGGNNIAAGTASYLS